MKSIRSTGDLAVHLGLSRWTVSRALNGHDDINHETAERIRAEAARLGFAPSLIGRTLRSGRTDWIGVTLPDLEDYHLTGKVSHLRELLAASGWQAMMHVGGGAEDERLALERFAAMRCGGVIAVASRCGRDPFLALHHAGIPCVTIDPIEEAGVDEVWTDRRAAMRMVVKHLNDKGCRSLIAAPLQPEGGRYSRQRWDGITAGAKACGWADDAANWDNEVTPLDIEAGRRLARRVSGLRRRPDAIVAINDRVAVGVLKELDVLGISVPKTIAVTGYNESELAAPFGLTSIDPRSDELIANAVELLVGRIKRPRGKTIRRLVIRPRLVARSSTGP